MAETARITIHHEGANAPRDGSGLAHYCILIGSAHYEMRWSPHDARNDATYHFNHQDLSICFTGQRHPPAGFAYPIADNDLALLSAACADARARGWVTDRPTVVAHRDSEGSSTACPGDNVMARWSDVVRACSYSPPTVKVKPMYDPPIAADLGFAAVWTHAATIEGSKRTVVLAAVAPNGDVYAWGVPYRKWPNQHVDFAGRRAAQIGQAKGLPFGRYTITATNGDKYTP